LSFSSPPFPISKIITDTSINYKDDPGFDVVINGNSSKSHKTEISIEKGFLDYAFADIQGTIDVDGKACVRVRSNKINLDDTQVFEEHFLLTGPVIFSAKYFIFKSETLSGLNLNIATEMARNYGGIRIYRNGFRVPPYGDPTDDWLRLDSASARREYIFPLSNMSVFGQVELGDENYLFEETSSREGLIENQAFEELRSFVRKSVEWAAARIAFIRERKQTASQKDFVSKARPPRSPTQVFGSFLSHLGEQAGPDARSSGVSGEVPAPALPSAAQSAAAEALAELERYETQVAAREAAALRYEEMLRILASLGLSVAVFGHEIKGVRSAVAAHIALMGKKIESLHIEEVKSILSGPLEKLHTATSRMFDLGGYIAGLMSSTESRELTQLSVKGALDRFVQQFGHYMERQGIIFSTSVDPANLRTAEMHRSEFDSVLLNFLTNSLKSMKKARVSPRLINISAKRDGAHVLVIFEDNGIGID
jgi:signal transduction histidine kinase